MTASFSQLIHIFKSVNIAIYICTCLKCIHNCPFYSAPHNRAPNNATPWWVFDPLSGIHMMYITGCSDSHTQFAWWQSFWFDLPTASILSGGSCVRAGFTECCTNGTCEGLPRGCFCDRFCVSFWDCCDDVVEVCPGNYIYMQSTTNWVIRNDDKHISINTNITASIS